ncbi:hypothetical protein BC834DRAFT_112337 [Gloeopeniophorella convolvens]|nr:hypothetical protein BC834DRAFT_112337 [Gloeopeniophorella convolvens]
MTHSPIIFAAQVFTLALLSHSHRRPRPCFMLSSSAPHPHPRPHPQLALTLNPSPKTLTLNLTLAPKPHPTPKSFKPEITLELKSSLRSGSWGLRPRVALGLHLVDTALALAHLWSTSSSAWRHHPRWNRCRVRMGRVRRVASPGARGRVVQGRLGVPVSESYPLSLYCARRQMYHVCPVFSH